MEKMSRPLPLNPSFIPPPYGVLRSLLENPLKLPLHHEDAFSKDKDKEKKLDDESNSPTVPQSAFLGPTLWDKTLPYDGDTFQLEYMDLEEFLSENGIPPSPSQHDHSPHPPGLQPASSSAPSVMDLSSRASAPIHPGIPSPNCMQSPIRPGLECLALIQLSLPAPAVPFQPGPWVSLGPSPWLTSSQGCWCVPSRDHILLTQRNLLGLPGSCSHVERNVFLRYTSLQLSLQNTVESWALGQAYISLWNTLSHHSLAEHPRQCLFGE
ncbi:hepatic leukemia factor isoform X2 [Vulpes vulpes]|uniref:Hepatic leukemia factor isoform X2 n=1 Tax=Vulpes vulpes TaxID=9627 RepID=A0ABM4ZM36_VULVU|nr:hepatic leukemia factor isoform X2 [Vulpes lagopus]